MQSKRAKAILAQVAISAACAASGACSLVKVTHCAYWNLLLAFGFDFHEPVCPGGQPAAPSLEEIKQSLPHLTP